ncbi:MAG: hypothetical protein C4560_11025 [Nitrospiraceae bacterium]|nr:MAG: hypothetical protein C4560_11025 [Nitrospiraceae bacterium]
MGNVDALMATDPLKQHIRQTLWEAFIKKLRRKPITYLTFYAPTIMDVKHLARSGYIKFEDSVYKGVVGITKDEKHGYPLAISEGKGRLELFKIGEAHALIDAKEKDFLDKFPFDVINLDYCNYIFGQNNNPFVSNNLKDISLIINQQRRTQCDEFILFLTTRTDRTKAQVGSREKIGFADNFLGDLKDRINLNIQNNSTFRSKYHKLFAGESVANIASSKYNEFVNIGIVKLLSMELASQDYGIVDCTATWLIRDEVKPQRDLLHMALHVKDGNVTKVGARELSSFGRYYYLERGAEKILERLQDGGVTSVTEKKDKKKLEELLGHYIKELREDTFEIRVPESLPE